MRLFFALFRFNNRIIKMFSLLVCKICSAAAVFQMFYDTLDGQLSDSTKHLDAMKQTETHIIPPDTDIKVLIRPNLIFKLLLS